MPDMSLAGQRGRICAECQEECGLKHLKGCRRRATLNTEAFHCPEGRF